MIDAIGHHVYFDLSKRKTTPILIKESITRKMIYLMMAKGVALSRPCMSMALTMSMVGSGYGCGMRSE